MIPTNSIWQSKQLSDTTDKSHFVRVILPEVEWVDNPNCSKNRTAYPTEVVLQRCTNINGVFIDEPTIPFSIYQEALLEYYVKVR